MSGSCKKRRNRDGDGSETPIRLTVTCAIGTAAKGNASGAFTLGQGATSTGLLKARHINGLGNGSSLQRSTLLRSDDLIAFEGLQRAVKALGGLDAKFSWRKQGRLRCGKTWRTMRSRRQGQHQGSSKPAQNHFVPKVLSGEIVEIVMVAIRPAGPAGGPGSLAKLKGSIQGQSLDLPDLPALGIMHLISPQAVFDPTPDSLWMVC